MSDEFAKLSDPEVMSLIRRAEEELARRRESRKETMRAEIEERLKHAGLGLADVFPELDRKPAQASGEKPAARPQRAVAAKYRNHVSGDSWSGRGAHPPQWVKSILMERGWTLEEFKASGEFDA